jgi:outer membrane protein assembly factor BamE (lipoprotein component of BamABCDE complex)
MVAGYGIDASSCKGNPPRRLDSLVFAAPVVAAFCPPRPPSPREFRMQRPDRTRRRRLASGRAGAVALRLAAAVAAGLLVAACNSEPIVSGYIADEKTLSELKPGTSAEAVLAALGTPSTVSTVGNQTWYYITQMKSQRLKFMQPTIVDQRVLAVNFDKNMKVERVASYGLQDGVVFDFISRTTPTGGSELSLVRQMLNATGLGG